MPVLEMTKVATGSWLVETIGRSARFTIIELERFIAERQEESRHSLPTP